MISYIKNKIRNRIRELNFSHLDRSHALHMAWGHIFNNHLRGDYWEFGVYKGNTMLISTKQYQKFKFWNESQLKSSEPWRVKLAKDYLDYAPKFFGFDTFSGIPANDEKESNFDEGNFASSLESVKSTLEKVMNKNSLKLVQGDFTKLQYSPTSLPIAILNIDSDLYESALAALKLSAPCLQIGSVILFDDFHCFNSDDSKGERRALSELLESSPIKVDRWFDYHYAGRAFLVTGI
jgi:O-methyltransferase